MIIDWAKRPGKRAATESLMELLGTAGPADTALFLPGSECLCVKSALDAGVISKSTRLLAAECKPAIFRQMVDSLETLEFDHRPTCYPGWVELYGPDLPPDLDLAYFDLCGGLTAVFMKFIDEHVSPRLHPGSMVAFTLACRGGDRSNTILKRARVCLAETSPPVISVLQSMIDVVGRRHQMRADQALGLAMALCAFRGWRMRSAVFPEYRDAKREMGMAVLQAVERVEIPGWPGVDEIEASTDWLDFSQHVSPGGAEAITRSNRRVYLERSARKRRLAELDLRLAAIRAEAEALERERKDLSLAPRLSFPKKTGIAA